MKSEEELKQARRGILTSFPESSLPRPSITIGIFPPEEEGSEEFQNFKKIAKMLYGRYQFVYSIQKGSVLIARTDSYYLNYRAKPSISTIRPLEKTKRVDYKEAFDHNSLIAHVTQNSIPSVVSFNHSD